MKTQKLKFTSEQRTQVRSVSLNFQTILKVSFECSVLVINMFLVQECSAKDSKLDTIHSWLYSCT